MAKVKIAYFNFDATDVSANRTAAAHGTGCVLPAGSIILDGGYKVITTFTSTAGGADKAGLAIHAEGANDLVTATLIEAGTNSWDVGLQAIIPVGTKATWVATTVAREVTVTVSVCALTGGELVGWLEYIVPAAAV